jgi:hypothetical protein
MRWGTSARCAVGVFCSAVWIEALDRRLRTCASSCTLHSTTLVPFMCRRRARHVSVSYCVYMRALRQHQIVYHSKKKNKSKNVLTLVIDLKPNLQSRPSPSLEHARQTIPSSAVRISQPLGSLIASTPIRPCNMPTQAGLRQTVDGGGVDIEDRAGHRRADT